MRVALLEPDLLLHLQLRALLNLLRHLRAVRRRRRRLLGLSTSTRSRSLKRAAWMLDTQRRVPSFSKVVYLTWGCSKYDGF